MGENAPVTSDYRDHRGDYQELVDESGWTPAEFETFVADSLQRQLL